MSDYPDYQFGARSVSKPSESVEGIDATQTGSVSDHTIETTIITPPEGYIYELLGLNMEVDDIFGATSGQHVLSFMTEQQEIPLLEGTAPFNEKLEYSFGHWEHASAEQHPSNEITQLLVPRGIRASENNGFKIKYENISDVDQQTDRTYKLVVRKIKVV